MNNIRKLSFLYLIAISSLNAQELEFDTLEITAKEVKEDEKQFATPGAVSSRGDIAGSTQSIDSIVRSMPGSYTNTDPTQGTVQVNIRGLTGLGRVSTKVDGVTQTFFGTSADTRSFHSGGGNIATSSYGALVDQNFLVSVDVTKGTFSSGHNGLLGGASFRTIEVDDVIREGKSFGFLGRYSHGTNGIGYNYMGAVAGKFKLQNGGSIGALFGYARNKISQDYKIGGGDSFGDQKVPNPYYDPSQPEDEWNYKYEKTAPYDPKKLTQSPYSSLFKLELIPNLQNKLVLSHRGYKNVLAGRGIKHNNYQLDYNLNPESDLVDLHFLASHGSGEQLYLDDAVFFGRHDLASKGGLTAKNKSTTFDLSNASSYNLGSTHISHRYGINYLSNKYENSMDMSLPGATSTPFQPKGRQRITSFYLDNSFTHNIFTLDANLNLSNWNISGHKPPCDANQFCFPKAAADIDKEGTDFNYSLMLSAKLHDLFMPFVSYSKTSRPPNVQEMFFSTNEGNGINPFLKPEKAKTWQIGFNAFKEKIFFDDDRLGFKILHYRTNVDDYIYNKSFYTTDAFMLHLNQTEVTKFSGMEVELSYDARKFYIRGSYSNQHSNQVVNETSGVGANSFGGYTEITTLPEVYANLDVGARLFDEKFVVGMIYKYTGDAYRVSVHEHRVDTNDPDDFYPELKTEKLPKIPGIFDLYASYQPFENLTIKFEVQNLFDKNYLDALNAFNGTTSQASYDIEGNDISLFDNKARGRTYKASIEYRY